MSVRLPRDDGAIFDNAMTEAESKRRDRTRGVLSALRSRERELGCCFSTEDVPTETTEGMTLLRFSLEPDGQLGGVEIVRERSTMYASVLAACLTRVLRETTFPASPAARETTVEYPIHVRRGG